VICACEGSRSAGTACEQRPPPPSTKAAEQPLMHRHGPLPAPRVEVGSAKRAARCIRCDTLAALGTVTGMHNGEDLIEPSEAAKWIVRTSEELSRQPDESPP
jgi:hypothetical protein